MSPIGRIFSVVNLILAALFLGWAANAVATNATYKSKYEKELADHQAEKTELDAALSKLRTEKQELETKSSRFMAERDDASARADRTKQDLESEVSKNAQYGADLAKIAATLAEIEASKGKLQADKDRAVQMASEAQAARTKAEASQREAEEKLADAQQELTTTKNTVADLEKARVAMEKEKKTADSRLSNVVSQTGVNLDTVMAMPQIDGRVLDVASDVDPGLISLNVGSTQGVARGFTFEIYDGKTYKGQVRVEYVHPNSSSAIIIRPVSGQKIRQGDSATTRL